MGVRTSYGEAKRDPPLRAMALAECYVYDRRCRHERRSDVRQVVAISRYNTEARSPAVCLGGLSHEGKEQ
jgi:hypothetical protein